jgi:hypothetical protein
MSGIRLFLMLAGPDAAAAPASRRRPALPLL